MVVPRSEAISDLIQAMKGLSNLKVSPHSLRKKRRTAWVLR